MQQAPLPESVQEIADVIGRERALYLVGALPTYVAGAEGKKSSRPILYVPKRSGLHDEHDLVRILGRTDAEKLAKHFDGAVLHPANCAGIISAWRDKNLRRLRSDGMSAAELAEWFGVTGRTVRNACAA